MDKLKVSGLTYGYDARTVVENIDIEVGEGEFVGIVGPNGSGKSTILKCIYGGMTPKTGEVYIDGTNIREIKPKKRATMLAAVGQENTIPFNFTVREIVSMGRTPHKRLFEPDNERDRAIVDEAMDKLGISALAERSYMNLSGGEKQRVIIARAFAQETELLVMDEPTNHLDINYQLQIFETLKASGLTVLVAIHDLNLAAMFCDRIYVLSGKQVYASGKTDDVLNRELIREVFHVKGAVERHPLTGKNNIIFIPNIQ